jgi:hypothetical protein
MDRHWELIPEDGAMRALLLVLGFRKPNTGQGIGDTLNKIEEHFKNRFAIGVVDDDKRKPKLFDLYENVLKEQDALRLLQKPQSRHFLIVVEPAIEQWLLNNAEKAVVETPFPTLKELQRVTKNELEVVKNQPFKQFLNALKQADAPGFVTMAEWIDVLYNKHY